MSETRQKQTSATEIGWLAGLLEGEGCFSLQGFRSPTIRLAMTDSDTVQRASAMFFGARIRRQVRRGNRKPQFSVCIHGIEAAQWMLTIYPLMGIRRRGKIRKCLEPWLKSPIQNKDKEVCKNGHPFVGENIQTTSDGRRCRICFKQYLREWRKAHPFSGRLTEEQRAIKNARAREIYRDDPKARARNLANAKRWRDRQRLNEQAPHMQS